MHYSIHGKVSIAGGLDLQVLCDSLFLRVYDRESLREASLFLPAGEARLWSDSDLDALSTLPLAREPLGPDGSFEIDIDDRQHLYLGGTLLAMLEVSYLPPMLGLEAAHPATHLVVGDLQPAWSLGAQVQRAISYDLHVTEASMALVMTHFEVRFVSGILLAQDTKLPIATEMISIYHETHEIGQGITNQDGTFTVWYRGQGVGNAVSVVAPPGAQASHSHFSSYDGDASGLALTRLGTQFDFEEGGALGGKIGCSTDSPQVHAATLQAVPNVRPPVVVALGDRQVGYPTLGAAEFPSWLGTSPQLRFYSN